MDLTIRIDVNALVKTLYKKPMVLYLFIPPHSVHLPGETFGHIYDKILCI